MTHLQTFSFCLVPLAVCLGVLAGCGGAETYEVSGTVTYDGEPVERGQISFVPLDGSGAADGGPIEDGEFSFPSKPGRKRVEIRGSRPLPPEQQDSPDMGLLYEDYIPEVYNAQSELTAEVTADGARRYDFELLPPEE